METNLLFHNISSEQLYFEGAYVDMDDSVKFEKLPRIGEKLILNDDLGFNEFSELNEEEIGYLESFLKKNYQATKRGYEFLIFDIIHFPGGKYSWICLKPLIKKPK